MLGFTLCKISAFFITAIKLDKPSMPHKPIYAFIQWKLTYTVLFQAQKPYQLHFLRKAFKTPKLME